MAARFSAYPEYKDSGVDWLGEVPSSWGVSKVKYLSPFQVGWTPPTGNDENFNGENLWANISDLGEKTISDTAKRISDYAAKVASMDITPRGSLLYSFKLSVGTVSFAGRDMYTNEAIASFLEEGKLPLSYLYFALPKFVIENASTNIYGARILNQELIKNAVLLAPAYEEAETIANFLDHETAKIDTLIDKQQQLIKLLKEKRQAVISHAVTKGLNPAAPMKDSGVEWLGEVPEHWVVAKLKYFADMQGGFAFSSETFQQNGIQLLRIGNVYQNRLDLSRQPIFIEPSTEQSHKEYVVKYGDILMSLTGTLGKRDYGFAVCVEDKDIFMLNQRLAKISPKSSKITSSYLLYSIWSNNYLDPLYLLPSGTKQANLSNENVLSINVAVPPDKEEQDRISQYLKDKLSRFDGLLNHSEGVISLLSERRTALISAAVTGKIDVRNWQFEHEH